MKTRIGIPVLLTSILLLVGCQSYYATTIYNNSGVDIVVLVEGMRYEWRSSQTLRISSEPGDRDIDPGKLALEYTSQGGLVHILVVESNSDLKRYRIMTPGIPEEYIEKHPGLRELFFQLERDGCIYVVKPGTSYPVDPLPPQPSGLPIHPDVNR